LIHPIYVDEVAHEHGGRSAEYDLIVERADREIGRLLDRVDLTRDLVVLTADHGHSDRGGHGGRAPQIENVLTCIAGPGVIRRQGTALLDVRTIAPALSVLLGLPFPSHMRAGPGQGGDDLNSIWDIVDASIYAMSYIEERRAAVEHFRGENAAALAHWLGHEGTWNDLYSRERRRHAIVFVLFIALMAIPCFVYRRQVLPERLLQFLLLTLGACAALIGTWTALHGSFDFTSIHQRVEFVLSANEVCALTGAAALFIRHRFGRDRAQGPRGALHDQLRLVAVLLVLNVGHIVAFGWPMGFPLPGPALLFAPLMGALFLAWSAVFALAGCLWLASRPAIK
jgi:hypothetical protein